LIAEVGGDHALSMPQGLALVSAWGSEELFISSYLYGKILRYGNSNPNPNSQPPTPTPTPTPTLTQILILTRNQPQPQPCSSAAHPLASKAAQSCSRCLLGTIMDSAV
jgi:hypothetical protein